MTCSWAKMREIPIWETTGEEREADAVRILRVWHGAQDRSSES